MIAIDRPDIPFLLGLGFWQAAIPAALGVLSSIFSNRSQGKRAEEANDEAAKACAAQNQRRAALGAAIGGAYGLDTNSTLIAPLMAPRPCPKVAGEAGRGSDLLGDLFGGGALLAGNLMDPNRQAPIGPVGTPPINPAPAGAPCPPPSITDPATGQCISPSDLFGGGTNEGTGYNPSGPSGV